MPDKNVTIQEIADALNISKSTVSKALSNATDINEQTREKILSKASELGYAPKARLGTQKNQVLLLTYAMDYSSMDQFAYEILMGFQSEAKRSGYHLALFTVSEEEMKTGAYGKSVNPSNYYGCFFIGFHPHHSFLEELERTKTPAVILDDNCDSIITAQIGCDNRDGIIQVVEHLVKQGYKKIAFLGGEADSKVTLDREQAYRFSLEQNAFSVDEKLIAYSSFQHGMNPDCVRQLTEQKATAIVCASDNIAIKTIRVLKGLGLSVPGDVVVTGFDDLPAASQNVPKLTSVFQNRVQIGKSAFMLLSYIKSGIEISQLLLKPKLMIRESSQRGE